MASKKKKRKKIKSLEKQKQEHIEKIEDYKGKDYTLPEYWEKEVKRIDREIDNGKEELSD